MLKIFYILGLNQLIANGVAHQLGRRFEIEFSHGRSAMGLDCFYTELECDAHFLVVVSFGNEPHDHMSARDNAASALSSVKTTALRLQIFAR